MAYYVGTREFPSVYAAVRYLAANPQPGVSVTSEPVVPADDNDLNVVNLVLGYLGGIVSSVVSFYFGASKSGSK